MFCAKKNIFFRGICLGIILCFLATAIIPPKALAQSAFNLPIPGTIVNLSSGFVPVMLKGLKVYPDNPFKFDFIVDSGNTGLAGDELKAESEKLARYFLASLTVPQDDLWVNLSPYEKDRIIPDALSQTDMGKDMLAQDYLLKQITASLIYPEGDQGKVFWKEVYKKAYEQYGTTNIPIDTFNKVWIVPARAVVYEQSDKAFVVESSLKVMIEEDYVAMEKSKEDRREKIEDRKSNVDKVSSDSAPSSIVYSPSSVSSLTSSLQPLPSDISSSIVREMIIPELEKEVNSGKNFSQLRQIYNAIILAYWFKTKLKDSILNTVYADRNKVEGIELVHSKMSLAEKDIGDVSSINPTSQEIYNQYLDSFKKGVMNFIKVEYDPYTNKNIPRKYFAGGERLGFGGIAGSSIIITANEKDLNGHQAMGDLSVAEVRLKSLSQPAASSLIVNQSAAGLPANTSVGAQRQSLAEAPNALETSFLSKDFSALAGDVILKQFPSDITFSLELEFNIKQLLGLDPGQSFTASERQRVIERIQSIVPPDWQLEGRENFNELKTKINLNTRKDWDAFKNILKKLNEGPMVGGLYSVHMHISRKSLVEGGQLKVDQRRLGRVGKVYEAMWRALSGNAWTKPRGSYVKVLDEQAPFSGGSVREHSRIINLSGSFPTIEIKIITGLLDANNHLNPETIEKDLYWAFTLLDLVSRKHDNAPLSVLGLPVLGGSKPKEKNIQRFLNIVYVDDLFGKILAEQIFYSLSRAESGASRDEQLEMEDTMKRAYSDFGLGLVYELHASHDGCDEDIVKHLLAPDNLRKLAEDLIRSNNANFFNTEEGKRQFLGFFPLEMWAPLMRAIREQLNVQISNETLADEQLWENLQNHDQEGPSEDSQAREYNRFGLGLVYQAQQQFRDTPDVLSRFLSQRYVIRRIVRSFLHAREEMVSQNEKLSDEEEAMFQQQCPGIDSMSPGEVTEARAEWAREIFFKDAINFIPKNIRNNVKAAVKEQEEFGEVMTPSTLEQSLPEHISQRRVREIMKAVISEDASRVERLVASVRRPPRMSKKLRWLLLLIPMAALFLTLRFGVGMNSDNDQNTSPRSDTIENTKSPGESSPPGSTWDQKLPNAKYISSPKKWYKLPSYNGQGNRMLDMHPEEYDTSDKALLRVWSALQDKVDRDFLSILKGHLNAAGLALSDEEVDYFWRNWKTIKESTVTLTSGQVNAIEAAIGADQMHRGVKATFDYRISDLPGNAQASQTSQTAQQQGAQRQEARMPTPQFRFPDKDVDSMPVANVERQNPEATLNLSENLIDQEIVAGLRYGDENTAAQILLDTATAIMPTKDEKSDFVLSRGQEQNATRDRQAQLAILKITSHSQRKEVRKVADCELNNTCKSENNDKAADTISIIPKSQDLASPNVLVSADDLFKASQASSSPAPGGIDLKSTDSIIKSKGEGIKFDVSANSEKINLELENIIGFTPVIINITPITSFNVFLGLGPDDAEKSSLELSRL